MKTLTPPPEGLTRRDLFKFSAIGLGSIITSSILAGSIPSVAYGAINKLSSNNLADLKHGLNLSSYQIENYKWSGVNGSISRYDNNFFFFVPVKNKNGGFIYTDFLDIYYKGNKIDNRDIQVCIHIDKLEVTNTKGNGVGSLGDRFGFCGSDKAEFWFINNTGMDSNYTPMQYRWFVDYTVTITWADTKEIVSGPFYQIVTDLDAGSNASYYSESWKSGSGFTGDFFIYDKNYLRINGNTFSAPKTGSSTSVSGDNSLIKAGVIAPTNNGKFSGRFEEGRCGTALNIYAPLTQIPAPEKVYSIK